jgi:hypothetical protein
MVMERYKEALTSWSFVLIIPDDDRAILDC